MSLSWSAGESASDEVKHNKIAYPKYTTTQRDALTAGQKSVGMRIYNITTGKEERWTGSVWEDPCKISGTSSCTLTGATNFSEQHTKAHNGSNTQAVGTTETTIATVTASLTGSDSLTSVFYADFYSVNVGVTVTLRLKRDGIQIFSENLGAGVGHDSSHLVTENNLASGSHTWDATAQSSSGTNPVDDGVLEILEVKTSDDHACSLSDSHNCTQNAVGIGGSSIFFEDKKHLPSSEHNSINMRKMTTTERDLLLSPDRRVGDKIFNTTTNQCERWTGSAWVRACQLAGTASCALTGSLTFTNRLSSGSTGTLDTVADSAGVALLVQNTEYDIISASRSPTTPNRLVINCTVVINKLEATSRNFTTRLYRGVTQIASDTRAATVNVAFRLRVTETDTAGGTYKETMTQTSTVATVNYGSGHFLICDHETNDTHACSLTDNHKCG